MVTLALLVLGASLMVAVSRASFRHVVAAREAADELRHRWGAVSVRTALLPYADSILTGAEAVRKAPTPSVRARFVLAGEEFDVLLSDEQAKADVNALLVGSDRATAESELREALSGTGLANVVRLRPGAVLLPGDEPATRPATQPATTQASHSTKLLSGFGQVFDGLGPVELLAVHGPGRAVDLLTCWGDGSVNLRRVSPGALRVACGTALSGVEQNRLMEARDAVIIRREARPAATTLPNPGNDPVIGLLAAAGVDVRSARGLPRFTLSSNCYSIWVATKDVRGRVTYFLAVRDQSLRDHPRTAAFSW